ncbi:MAG: hypothetical protein NTY10_07040, partial [Candidatus Omnitrophica bacterium]|nr:hypothetical protein [Candidatus Omnitrophota bacterium]
FFCQAEGLPLARNTRRAWLKVRRGRGEYYFYSPNYLTTKVQKILYITKSFTKFSIEDTCNIKGLQHFHLKLTGQ